MLLISPEQNSLEDITFWLELLLISPEQNSLKDITFWLQLLLSSLAGLGWPAHMHNKGVQGLAIADGSGCSYCIHVDFECSKQNLRFYSKSTYLIYALTNTKDMEDKLSKFTTPGD